MCDGILKLRGIHLDIKNVGQIHNEPTNDVNLCLLGKPLQFLFNLKCERLTQLLWILAILLNTVDLNDQPLVFKLKLFNPKDQCL